MVISFDRTVGLKKRLSLVFRRNQHLLSIIYIYLSCSILWVAWVVVLFLLLFLYPHILVCKWRLSLWDLQILPCNNDTIVQAHR